MKVSSFEPRDARSIEVMVAGPAALVVAKVHKISDRVGTDRLSDALDIVRLLRGVSTAELAERFGGILGDGRSRAATERGLELLKEQFIERDGIARAMISRAVAGLADPQELTVSAEILANDLLAALRH